MGSLGILVVTVLVHPVGKFEVKESYCLDNSVATVVGLVGSPVVSAQGRLLETADHCSSVVSSPVVLDLVHNFVVNDHCHMFDLGNNYHKMDWHYWYDYT